MSAFLDPFRGAQTGWAHGRPVWTTLAPLRYRSRLLGQTLVVPAQFITDLASVPRLPLLWLAAGGRGPRAATLHDFAYQFGFWWLARAVRRPVSKATADRVFHEALRADPISGAGAWRAWQMAQAVRWGGRGVWANAPRRTALNPEWSAGRWETS